MTTSGILTRRVAKDQFRIRGIGAAIDTNLKAGSKREAMAMALLQMVQQVERGGALAMENTSRVMRRVSRVLIIMLSRFSSD